MGFWSKLVKEWSFKKKPKTLFPEVEQHIIEAFRVKGKVYYQYRNTADMGSLRAIKTMTYYTEMQMRCDFDYLKQHVTAVDAILTSQRIDIYRLKQYNDYLKDRLKWIVDTDLVYKLASVVFFDETENPLDYDPAYNQEKIAFWKDNIPVRDFFYSAPVINLIPFLKNVDINLTEYSAITAQVKQQQLKSISSH